VQRIYEPTRFFFNTITKITIVFVLLSIIGIKFKTDIDRLKVYFPYFTYK